MRRLVLHREVVDQRLCVLGLERDHASEQADVVRVVHVESLGNEFGVRIVLGKHNGLAQPVSTRHLVAACHERLQHLVHCVGVE
ncbi:hypothetical protein D9M69_622860 [compost metagenome]